MPPIRVFEKMENTFERGAIVATCKLEIPDELTSIGESGFNVRDLSKERIIDLSNLMAAWTAAMQTEIDLIKNMKAGHVQYDNAMAFYEFWRQRFVNFKTILEQLSTSKPVRTNVSIVEACVADRSVFRTYTDFADTAKTLKIVYDSTVKNVKYFMDSVYEGIHAIHNAPFADVADYFTLLFNNLNLMWLTSSFFSQKKYMERLFESISNSIADRVSDTLSIPEIFNFKTMHALSLTSNAIRILEQWKSKYMEYKKDIHLLSTRYFTRWAWEFDEDIIFNRLNFVRFIVDDLQKIIEIIKTNMMNPEVEYLFKNSSQTQSFLKDITRVFFNLETNVYKCNEPQIWKDAFDKFLICFEDYIYERISESIDVSKNAIDDYNALQFFEKMMIRDKLVKKLHPKYAIVLDKFAAEIDSFNSKFMSLVRSPRPMLNVPTVAANIITARDLFSKAKKVARVVEPSARFPPADKNKTLSAYGDLCRRMLAYEKDAFDGWLRDAVDTEARQMRRGSLLVFRDDKLASTFDKRLFRVTDAALQLRLLGFELPVVVACLVDKREQIRWNVRAVDRLVGEYNGALDRMDVSAIRAMNHHFTELKQTMRPALENRFTYLSFKLPKFVEERMRSLKEFNRIYNEIESYERLIAKKLKLIENLTFFSTNDDDNIADAKRTFKTLDRFKTQGNENVSTITNAMTYIMEALNLIEKICYDVQTGHHKQMSLFYEKYENALFESFVKMVLNNFKEFQSLADGKRGITVVIHGRMVNDKFALVPHIQTVAVTLVEAVDYVSKCLRSVPRWLRNTNIRCPLVQNAETSDSHLPYSFYEHGIMGRGHVYEAEKKCYDSIKEIGVQLEAVVKKFTRFGFLFEKHDGLIIDQFAATGPSLNDYGEKLEFFAALSRGLGSQSRLDVGCVRLDYSEYNDKLMERCAFWRSVYGDRLTRQLDETTAEFSDRVADLRTRLNAVFRDCHELEVVETAIKQIKESVYRADSTFHDSDRRVEFMARHGITVPKELSKHMTCLKTNWRDLYKEALAKSFCLEDAKRTAVSRQ